MRRVLQRNRFRRDYKLQLRRGKNIAKFDAAVWSLARNGTLDRKYQSHRLSGVYEGLWECHIESDWLLIYDVTEAEIVLARTGTHSDLFGR